MRNHTPIDTAVHSKDLNLQIPGTSFFSITGSYHFAHSPGAFPIPVTFSPLRLTIHEAAGFPEIPAGTYKSALHHVPEDCAPGFLVVWNVNTPSLFPLGCALCAALLFCCFSSSCLDNINSFSVTKPDVSSLCLVLRIPNSRSLSAVNL